MESKEKSHKKWMTVLILGGFLSLFLLGIAWYNTAAQNIVVNEVSPSTVSENVSVRIDDDELADKWETRIQLSKDSPSGEVFYGATRSCVIVNNNEFAIKNWTLRININDICYLNGFWCGDFEVHQFRKGEEITELVQNSQNDNSNLKLEYNEFSDNLMIHLLPGDYLIYHPSFEANETTVKARNAVGLGFIFYSQFGVDLSDYELLYHNDCKITKSVYFIIALVMVIVWLLGLLFYHLFHVIGKKYITERNNSIQSISIMAGLYLEVHMINLNSDTGYLIKGDQNKLLFNFIGTKVSDYFAKYILEDCQEKYRSELSKYLNLFSVRELIKNVSSISFEYESIKMGWVSIRFLKMEKDPKNPQLIFTVQDINDEKIKSNKEREKLLNDEYVQLIKSRFLNSITNSIDGITKEILEKTQYLNASVKSEEEKKCILQIGNSVEHFKLLQDCVYDMMALESGNFNCNIQQYNFYEMIDKITEILRPYYENKEFEFQKSIETGIPEFLEGDEKRLMQILMLILTDAFFTTKKGFVKLSVFAKQIENSEELIISVRDTAEGFTEEQMKEVNAFLKGSRINSFDNLSLVYLKTVDEILKEMKSGLKIVSQHGSGSEFYFSIKQEIVGKK